MRLSAWLLCLALGACAHVEPGLPAAYVPTLLSLSPVGRPLPRELYGRVVVVQFFTTYCFPCLVMLPRLEELKAKYGGQGLVAAAVGMDLEGPLVLLPFEEHYQFSFPILLPSEAMRQGGSAFGPLTTLPLTVVLDREGRLLAGAAGVIPKEQLDSWLAKAVHQVDP